jgi:predicted metal-dependent HD superfamily phosphohydrolase
MHLTLEARWQQLLTPLAPDADLRRQGYQQLSEAYSQSGRHYHDLTHIRLMLSTLDGYLPQLQDAATVQLAVWFHDAVYSPLRSDNEARSAELARQFLARTNLSAPRRERVAYLIERTKDHTQPQPAADTDLHLLLDVDLQILGAPEADYWRYARQVRQEYALVPDLLYRPGRQKVLTKFLELPHLYQTEPFRQRLETQARRNLQAELKAWQQNQF